MAIKSYFFNGIEIDARLVEVIESIDETGRYSAVPTFSI